MMDSLRQWIQYRRPEIWGALGANPRARALGLYWGWYFPCSFGLVQLDKPRQVGPSQWRWRVWSSAGYYPTYYVYVDGEEYCTNQTGVIDLYTSDDEKLSVEVLDDPSATPSAAPPARVTLQWAHATTAVKYRIEQYVDGAWATKDTITADGRTNYWWRSDPLADATTHQFRVIAIDRAGNEGTSQTLTKTMGRPDDAPQVSYFYDNNTGKIHITEVS